jgi:hypothetical protein
VSVATWIGESGTGDKDPRRKGQCTRCDSRIVVQNWYVEFDSALQAPVYRLLRINSSNPSSEHSLQRRLNATEAGWLGQN